MAIRMQQRRGTASQWTSANPILNAGEMGWESDTNKFKIGDGVNLWANLDYFIDANSTANPSFGTSIIFEGATADSYETTLTVTDPTADRTITFPDATGTVALTSDISELSQDAIDSALTAGTGITKTYNDSANTLTLAVDTTTIQSRVADVSDTEIGYLNGVTSGIQTQLDDKSTASKTETLTNKTLTSPVINTPTGITKTDVGLANVDNTTDANKPVSTATQTELNLKAPLASPTFTGSVTLPADPASALQAATKQYVDNTASGVIAKPQVLGATTANIDATYSNGTAGVGATLTHNTNGVFPSGAGGASGWAVGKGILVKNQTNKAQNGRYYVSDMGSVSTPYVLTRCTYCDEASEIPGAYIFVQDGTLAGTGWIQVVADPATFTVGTDDIDVFQFSGSGTITAGTGITVNGNQVSINTAATVDLSTSQTLTNKTLTSPKINEDVAVTATATELNVLDGITSSTAELNILDGVTSTTAELNILDGVTSTASELNILDGATLTVTELNYVDGVTSAIQTQLNAKIAKADITAKGAILVGTGSGTYTAQSVGTNGQVLTANSAQADGVEWTSISSDSRPDIFMLMGA
jgi:hypothetical protein